MKRIHHTRRMLSAALLLMLLCAAVLPAGAETISPTTGLPIPGESTAPVMVVISQVFGKVKQDGRTIEAPGVGDRQWWGGLQADLVFESQLFQKSDTRLLFLYHDALVRGETVTAGPVRSLRDVHVKLAAAWNAGVVCRAAYPYTSVSAERGQVFGLYEPEVRPYLRTAEARWARDNAGADVNGIHSLMGDALPAPACWRFDGDAPAPAPYEGDIRIMWAGDKLETGFTYDAADNEYRWHANGVPMKSWQDDSFTAEAPMTFQNVILLYAAHSYPKTPLLPEVALEGAGTLRVYTRGGCIEGSWQEEDGYLQLTDTDGQHIALCPGRSYMAVLPAE